MKYLTLVSVLAITTAPVVAQASTLTDSFSSFWVLGDSLSDNGNTATMVGGLIAQQPGPIPLPPPNPLQQPGVSSDGFTWAKEFTDAFSAAGKATYNLSFGAARATNNASGPPDLAAQIDEDTQFSTTFTFGPGLSLSGSVQKYPDGSGGLIDRKSTWGDNPLVTVFVGGNDFLDATFDVAQSLAEDPFSNPDVVDETLNSVKSQIDRLVLEGIDDFIVMNLPDFSVIPQFNGAAAPLGAALSLAASRYNTQLEDYLDLLRDDGIDVTTVDIFNSLTDSQKLDEFGLTEVDNACVDSVDPQTGDCSGFLYFDNIHPTAEGHRLVAEITREQLNKTYQLQAVPLPAPALMLITALSGTLLLRRRKTIQ
ncbi:MAG: SGNH/GDSL hydrolase family protein [Roseobacter sp.]